MKPYRIEENVVKVLAFLVDSRLPDVDGDAISKSTGLTPENINDAIDYLESLGAVDLYRGMGTTPYKFSSVSVTAQGKYLYHQESKIAQPKETTGYREPEPVSGKSNLRDSTSPAFDYDIFICYASENRNEIARPLAEALRAKGLRVWYDEFELRLGDSLRRKIDHGLATSRYGVVILSKAFFGKEWTQKELDGLVAREDGKHKVILPIWHGVDKEYVAGYSPTLADKVAVSTDRGLDSVVREILTVVSYAEQVSGVQKSLDLSSVRERARSFRAARISKIIADETPMPFYGKARIAHHLVPVVSLELDQEYDLKNNVSVLGVKLCPMSCMGWNHTFNFDGFLTYSGGKEGRSHSYVQLYRNGVIEAVEGLLLEPHGEKLLIPSIAYEKELINSLRTYMSVLETLGVKPPIFVFLTLLGVEGYSMASERFLPSWQDRRVIDRDNLLIPEEVVYRYDVDPAEVLKPCFDLIWNACGYSGSLNYNEEGKWSPRGLY